MSAEWRKLNLICAADGDGAVLKRQPLPVMPPELLSLFEKEELSKYLTADELSVLDTAATEKGKA